MNVDLESLPRSQLQQRLDVVGAGGPDGVGDGGVLELSHRRGEPLPAVDLPEQEDDLGALREERGLPVEFPLRVKP